MMIFSDKDLSPNIQKFLPLIDKKYLFNNNYNLKHPGAIYNVSLSKIENSLKDFFDVYKAVEKIENFEEFEKEEKNKTSLLLKNYKNFLYCLREHLDDCFSIVKTFVQVDKIINERNQYLWLQKNANSVVKDFFKNISEYKKYLDNSVNELKHNNATLCSIVFYNFNNCSDNCFGYYVANVNNGGYEPIEKVHKKFNNSATGFSYRRDIIYNLFNVYYISEEMISLLKNKIGIDFKLLTPKTIEAAENKKKIFKNIMEMARYHFPDEYLKPVPSLSLAKGNYLKLEYPSLLSIKPNLLNRVVATMSGDGHTAKFKIPYM
ncbi:MAG: hypothetical protein WC349_03885 [Patescibacteria group bacterium]|jgi:hypothetical protein